MCRQSDQSWRAASLSGGKLWEDPILANNEDGSGYGFNNDDDEMEMGDEIRLGLNVAKGNVNRKMWKMMCRKIAGAVSYNFSFFFFFFFSRRKIFYFLFSDFVSCS